MGSESPEARLDSQEASTIEDNGIGAASGGDYKGSSAVGLAEASASGASGAREAGHLLKVSVQTTRDPRGTGRGLTAGRAGHSIDGGPPITPCNRNQFLVAKTPTCGAVWLPSIAKAIERLPTGCLAQPQATPFKLLQGKPSHCSSRGSSTIVARRRASSLARGQLGASKGSPAWFDSQSLRAVALRDKLQVNNEEAA